MFRIRQQYGLLTQASGLDPKALVGKLQREGVDAELVRGLGL